MSNFSQASQPNKLNVARSNLNALTKSVPPVRGFSAPRYEQLFEDGADLGGPGGGNGGFSGWSYWQPADPDDDPEPYQDTLLLIHSNRRGIRISFQASRRVAVIILLIILVILIKPGILDMLASLVKSALGGN